MLTRKIRKKNLHYSYSINMFKELINYFFLKVNLIEPEQVIHNSV